MDKIIVDKIITDYMGKIFGFALTHMSNTDKAEELAARITCEVYESLLKAQDVHNLNGYVYRIARNVYARFVDEERNGRHLSLYDLQLSSAHDFTADIEREEAHARLRREISYMAGIQRKILVLHYFERLKQNEIAERLQIPIGTVKWHLHDARKQLKESVTKMRKPENLALQPIQFDSMGHNGNPGPNNKATDYYLAKRIAQNIAYAAYHEARTITEIAEAIGVPAAFVEDEVAYLEDNGFMDKLPGGKYLTNICIHEATTAETENQWHENGMHYAKIICEKYVPLVIDAVKAFPSNKVYTPKGDMNFLLWSAITLACGQKLKVYDKNTPNIYQSHYNVKRPDGGEYIAHASVSNDLGDWKKLNFNPQKYSACGDMNRGNGEICAWQLDTYYDNRTGYWEDNLNEDYVYLHDYMTGKMIKDAANADKFQRLFDKGYVIAEGDSEYVNMLVTSLPREEFTNLLPAITDELKVISKELDEKTLNTVKHYYPAHMQDLVRMQYVNNLSSISIRTRVLELLLENGTLKPLTDAQKHSVNTILFCDMLPHK